ncbi:MAG: hypothetical protein JSS20_08915 [Proteobacteria bacterium]|nr:hypothetical protein [Pseudomonadota bacterium]
MSKDGTTTERDDRLKSRIDLETADEGNIPGRASPNAIAVVISALLILAAAGTLIYLIST